ncbi:MAG: SDR family oxidoreductase [Chitinophagaceae bacterium]
MNLNLKGRNAIVCGSTQGLGLASAVELALLGANVILMARNEEKLKSVVKTLSLGEGQEHGYIVADFQYPDQVKKAIANFLKITGSKVQILVNNSGGPKGGPALSASPSEFIDAFNAHLIANHILVQALVDGMKEAGYGRIVNIISTSVKQPLADLGVSNTTRGAVANWSKTLATELGPFGITVNNVLPGFTRTSRFDYVVKIKAEKNGITEEEIEKQMIATIPVRRIAEPEEFGAAVAFLCTPAAGYINGINLPVDGGRLGTL